MTDDEDEIQSFNALAAKLRTTKAELQIAKRELNEARAVLAVLYSWFPSTVQRATYEAGENAARAGAPGFNQSGALPEAALIAHRGPIG